ncbi:unnamed protein product [Prorocentrum cordatum]|uniref:Uncharacterized protein n=1 Tax=Prorocentrum cordatum TaxID=2364126 RepID=A0ABN9UXM8_9DINO|nr:unnamed protein product [Polarella glacialis]
MRNAMLMPTAVSYNAAISSCDKGKQWQRALYLLSESVGALVEPSVIGYNAGVSACEKCGQWRHVLSLVFGDMLAAKLEPDVIACTAGISACEKGGVRSTWTSAGQLLVPWSP